MKSKPSEHVDGYCEEAADLQMVKKFFQKQYLHGCYKADVYDTCFKEHTSRWDDRNDKNLEILVCVLSLNIQFCFYFPFSLVQTLELHVQAKNENDIYIAVVT